MYMLEAELVKQYKVKRTIAIMLQVLGPNITNDSFLLL